MIEIITLNVLKDQYSGTLSLSTCGSIPSLYTEISRWGNSLLLGSHAVTRKQRQSYRHATPRRQRPQAAQRRIGMRNTGRMVTSNRANVKVTLTYDLLTSGSMHVEQLL